ncbi:hypothetical protein G7Y89_g12732 [Cudoniella acicularis]|uniref:Uncharacterized protein n=1 Tax=Cudoniella acicularis TaxID=354080 RepID=A0A8H4RAV5_9HELO|nr:hypothetical protein G7Y89_g12732 [Cudoniella acicularis]
MNRYAFLCKACVSCALNNALRPPHLATNNILTGTASTSMKDNRANRSRSERGGLLVVPLSSHVRRKNEVIPGKRLLRGFISTDLINVLHALLQNPIVETALFTFNRADKFYRLEEVNAAAKVRIRQSAN